MPIPLGVLAVAGAGGGGGAAGAYELLETQIMSDDLQSSVSFSNLNSSYGSTYQHLQIRFVAKSTEADTSSAFGIELNSDTGSNYARHRLLANIAGGVFDIRSDNATSQASMVQVAHISGNSAASDIFGGGVIDVLDPFETTKNTTVRLLSGFHESTDYRVGLSSGFWNNTNAVTTIKLTPRSGNFKSGSRISLYGLRITNP
jgi:hypothetical protein